LTLAKAMWKQCKFEECTQTNLEPSQTVVVDGGFLLHRIPWKIGNTFHDICQSYSSFLKQRYYNLTTVVLTATKVDPTPQMWLISGEPRGK